MEEGGGDDGARGVPQCMSGLQPSHEADIIHQPTSNGHLAPSASDSVDLLASSLSYASIEPELVSPTRPGNPTTQTSSNLSPDDDLIPPNDPCYLHLKLRDKSVELLHFITARTILDFIDSLLPDQPAIDLLKDPSVINQFDIVQVVTKNQTCLARNARLETQLIVGQYLLESRSSLIDDLSITSSINEDHQKTSKSVETKISDYITNQFNYSLPSLTTLPSTTKNQKITDLISVFGTVISWDKVLIYLSNNKM
ncbi:hypothetical protein O181_001513 [Austropuccinia psidii MF-1]|uniref:Uncharacterized protein n=1 Tax=Austropuccinia psidii MF-1 TaxID=1389203 RepID=A0A9Q3GBS6_9BASI|nr:hypothetical protein [Austropuccinia psidii MF-1]